MPSGYYLCKSASGTLRWVRAFLKHRQVALMKTFPAGLCWQAGRRRDRHDLGDWGCW